MLQREALTDETSEKEGGREVKCQERGPSVPEIETNMRRANHMPSLQLLGTQHARHQVKSIHILMPLRCKGAKSIMYAFAKYSTTVPRQQPEPQQFEKNSGVSRLFRFLAKHTEAPQI